MSFIRDIPMDRHAFNCTEKIEDVSIAGRGEKQIVFVHLKRVIYAGRYPGEYCDSEPKDGMSPFVYVIERQVSAFMRNYNPEGNDLRRPFLECQGTPEFVHTIIPTRDLLFRFSALTLNSHTIHLDETYCREVEGYRNLVVQGKLMVVLAVEVLRKYLLSLTGGRSLVFGLEDPSREPEKILTLRYRNLRPLYVDEEMKICIRKNEPRAYWNITTWSFWIEGKDGRRCFVGIAKTVHASEASRLPDEERTIPDENVA